jgi:hypothetical protein
MIQKTIGLYNDSLAHSPFNKDTLVIEVANEHVVCLVKSEDDQKVTAFEFFKIELDNNDWEDVFYELRTNSGLMDKSYNESQIYYHVAEAILVPAYKYNNSVIDAYLNLMFGEDEKTVAKTDAITVEEEKIYTIYRINQTLQETINRNFLSIQEHHVYNGILNASNMSIKIPESIHVNFYANHCIIHAFKNRQLQIIQSFTFATADDVLYNIMNVVDKFKLHASNISLTIGGSLNTNDETFKKLLHYFKNLRLTVVDVNQSSLEKLSTYPLHYFSPFFNLQA